MNNYCCLAKSKSRNLIKKNKHIIYKFKCKKSYFFLFLSIIIVLNAYFVNTIVRKNEAIYCLIGFGIGVGCCILYEFIKKYFLKSPNSSKKRLVLSKSHETETSSPSLLTTTTTNKNEFIKKKFQIEEKLDYVSFKFSKKSKISSMINDTPPSTATTTTSSPLNVISKQNNLNINCSVKKYDSDSALKNLLCNYDLNNNFVKNSNSNDERLFIFNNEQYVFEKKNIVDDEDSNIQNNLNDDMDELDFTTNSTEKLININVNDDDDDNSAEKGFDKALDQIDRLKEDMSHLCTDIDLLYKSTISTTGGNKQSQSDNDNTTNLNENESYNEDVAATSIFKDLENEEFVINEDLLDWNMHDVLHLDVNSSLCTLSSDVASQDADEPPHNHNATPHNNNNLKYCKCCKKKIKFRSYSFYDDILKNSTRQSTPSRKIKKSFSNIYLINKRKKVSSRRSDNAASPTRDRRRRRRSRHICSNTNINCNKFYNFS